MIDSQQVLSAPTQRVLFGPLPSSDMPAAVVRRLRAAIGLGFLADGEKLPREIDLAKQLGVTSFTLREALSVLRGEGLIATRPGKNGGSFVVHPPQRSSLAHDELVRLTSVELRDLGDWREMVTTHSAALAAERAADADLQRLEAALAHVHEATSTEQARRGHGRFHLELAAAAQSIRLSRAELAVHEEAAWLFALVLGDDERRRASAAQLRDIVSAVRAQDPRAAHRAGARWCRGQLHALSQLRLHTLAARQVADAPAGQGSSLGAEVARFARELTRQLEQVSAAAGPVLASGQDAQRTKTQITAAVIGRLATVSPLVNGLGVIAEVGVVPTRPYWMCWWIQSEEGPAEDPHHVMDPDREDFYDYSDREFIAHPRAHRQPWASGPYVDYGGVNDYTVTVSSPIVVEGRFVGVAAADLLVSDLERMLAPWLTGITGVGLLLNSEGRVIVSNSVTHNVGDVLRTLDGARTTDVGAFGWRVLSFDPVATAP